MTFQKRTTFYKILAFLIVCTLTASIAPLIRSATTTGRGSIITYVAGHAEASNLRYTGDSVKSYHSVDLANYSSEEGVSYTFKFKLALTEVRMQGGEEVRGPDISSTDFPGSGALDAVEADDPNGATYMDPPVSTTLTVSAENLDAGERYGIDAYTRLIVHGVVNGKNREEHWFAPQFDPFTAW